ncbi:hypothetical protein [Candidatus Burkholderia verschuerenii]|uniref:hypothetical protein n=1 Tax=Candidatus Burkholderia verschuerenii TaxID=242163 RepID=UPI001E4400BB|nr:hypothetical protein [Candidatus Burkholderia verschuerenii]
MLLAEQPQRLAQSNLDHSSDHSARDAEPRRFGEPAGREMRRQRHRLLERERRIRIGLNAHGAERRTIELRFREQHDGALVAIGVLDGHLLGELRQMTPVSGASHGHGLIEARFITDDTDSKRHPLRFLKRGHHRKRRAVDSSVGVAGDGASGKVEFHL